MDFYKFNIQLKPHETALELFAPDWETAAQSEAYQKLISQTNPRQLKIVEHKYSYIPDLDEHPIYEATPENIEWLIKNSGYPPLAKAGVSTRFQFVGDESILAPLRDKIEADYAASLAEWKSAYDQSRDAFLEKLEDVCAIRTAYANLTEYGYCYPHEYMKALAEEGHPLLIISEFYKMNGYFKIEPEAEKSLTSVFNSRDCLDRYGRINPRTEGVTDHSVLMVLLDRTLDREYQGYTEKWDALDFDGLCSKAIEIYSMRQLHHTLRFDKSFYAPEKLDVMAQLAEPMSNCEFPLVAERELYAMTLDEINHILPQMYPDITPQQSVWEMPEEEPDSFTIKQGKEAEYQALKEENASDFYAAGIFQFAERWGGMMEQELGDGFTVAEAAVKTEHQADTEGITGYMYDCAVNVLSDFWEHGEELWQWHNLKYDFEGSDVINPAVLKIQDAEDDSPEPLSEMKL